MSLIKFTTCTDAYKRNGHQNQKHAANQNCALDPKRVWSPKYSSSQKGGGRKDGGGQQHSFQCLDWQKERVHAQGQKVKEDNPKHPCLNDLCSLPPQAMPEEMGKLAIQANVARSSTEQAVYVSHNFRRQVIMFAVRGMA